MNRHRPILNVLALLGAALVLTACTVTLAPEQWPARRNTVVVQPGHYPCSYGQVGVTVDERLVVVGLTEGGPARRAGIRLGDEVVSVSDRRVSTIADAQRLGLGPPGTLVNLTVFRAEEGVFRSYVIRRSCLR